MDVIIPFILISENEAFLETLKKIILRAVPSSPIHSFQDGLEGWDFIAKKDPNNIILCEMTLQTLGGMQILKNIKSSEELKKNYVVVITPDNDKEMNLKAMQQGSDDFLNKPFSVDDFISKLRTATRVTAMRVQADKLIKENQELQEDLQKKSQEIKDILYLFEKEKYPGFEEAVSRITEMALWIAEESGNNEIVFISQLEEACKLCYIGKLYLADGLIGSSVTNNGLPKSEKFERIPDFVTELIGKIKGLEPVYEILFSIFENYDGSGVPDKKQSRQIPFGSRILRAVLDYEEYYIMKKYQNDKIVEMLATESKRLYDPKVMALMDQYQGYRSTIAKIPTERTVSRKDLAEGMIISRQIITETGNKIMGAGTFLTLEFVEKIQSITKVDPQIGKIYVKIT